MGPFNLIHALMQSDAFQKLHSFSNPKQAIQKNNPTINLTSLLPAIKGEMTETTTQHSSMTRLDTVEFTSNDSNPVFQQHITLQDKAVHIRIAGRKKENGKVDPNFCHLIISLELQNLKEIEIDVKVQNRILSIAIHNQTDGLHMLVEELKSSFQTNLETQGYQLSSVKIVNSLKNEKLINQSKFEAAHERVDVKI